MLYALTLLIVPISGAGLARYIYHEHVSKRANQSSNRPRARQYVEHVTSAEDWIAPDVARIWFDNADHYSCELGSKSENRPVKVYPALGTTEAACQPIA
jgi:hypothetical protein